MRSNHLVSVLPLTACRWGKSLGMALFLGLGAVTLIGCGSEGDSARIAQTIDASKNGVTQIALKENEGYAHFKGSLQLNLIGSNDQQVTTNLNRKATWTLSDPSLGSIKEGLFTAAGAVGELIVTAEYAGLSVSQNLIVSDADLESISVDTATSAVDECQNASFTATALFDNGLTLEYPLTWVVTQGQSIARFPDEQRGELRTTNSGTVQVVARGKNNSGETISSAPFSLTINDSLVDISLTSDKALEMREGDSATLTVTGTYQDNHTANIFANTTLSANPRDAVSIEGAKIQAKKGSYTGTNVVVTGACGGLSKALTLVVLKQRIESIEIKNSNGGTNNLSVTQGSNLELKITATFTDNSTDNNYTHKVRWSIDESQSDDFDRDLITLDQTGKLSVSADLDLILNQQIGLVVRAEVLNDDDQVATNPDGELLVDEITVIVRP